MKVCDITDRHGAKYSVRQISAAPLQYVAFTDGPVEHGPLHRDGQDIAECMHRIAVCIAHREVTMRQIGSVLGLAQ